MRRRKIEGNKDVLANGNLSIQLYVKQAVVDNKHNTEALIADVKASQKKINASLENLFTQLNNIGMEA